MSLKTYIPSDIESNVASIKDSGSTVSANYFTTNLVRPTAISRNMKELETESNVEYDLSVVPLTLPLYHSSGNNLKSRSFDYDFVLGNTNNTTDNHFFVFDAGSTTWFVTFSSKTETERTTSYSFDVYETNRTVDPEATSTYKCIDLSKYKKVMTSKLADEEVEGYVLDYLEFDFTFEVEESQEEVSVVEEGQTVVKTIRTITITPDRKLTEDEEDSIRNIGVLTAFTNDKYESNIRFAGKLEYESNLRDFYIYNSTSRYGNMRDFLETLNEPAHAAFVGKVEDLKGLLFNIETLYNSDENLLNLPQGIPDSLGDSTLNVYLRDFSYLAYEELFFKVPDDTTSFTGHIKVQTKSDAGDVELLESIDVTVKTPKQIYNELLPYGLVCLPLYKRFTTESTRVVETPGATPEDPPVQETITETVDHVLLKGFYVKRFSSIEEEDETLQIVFVSSAEGQGYTFTTDVLDSLNSSLKDAGKFTLKAIPSETSNDKLAKCYNLARRDPQKSFSNIVNLRLDSTSPGSLSVADATSLNSTLYNYSQPSDISFTVSPFFNRGSGVEAAIQTIKDTVESLADITVKTAKEYAYLYLDAKNSAVKSLSLSATQGLLSTSSQQCLTGADKLLINFDTTQTDDVSFEPVPKLPFVVVDLYSTDELHVNPFAYITPTGLLKEQDVASIDEIFGTELFTSYEQRFQYLKSLADIWSASTLSSYLLPVIPLYDNQDEFSGCVAIYYDPCTIEGRTLETTLVKGKGDFLLTNQSTLDLKYISGYSNSEPVFTALSTLPPNVSQIDQTSYFNIQSDTLPNLYSTTFEYSFNDNYNVKLKVLDKVNNVVESISIVKDASRALNDIIAELNTTYLSFENSIYPNTLRVSIKPTVTDPRYVVTVENIEGGGLVTSKLLSKSSTGVLNIPLNRSV